MPPLDSTPTCVVRGHVSEGRHARDKKKGLRLDKEKEVKIKM